MKLHFIFRFIFFYFTAYYVIFIHFAEDETIPFNQSINQYVNINSDALMFIRNTIHCMPYSRNPVFYFYW